MQHLIERRRRERAHIRKSRHEALVVRNHGRDLRLLQHDLRHPHPIGRGVLLPGQVMPALNLEPGEQTLGELLGFEAHLLNNPSNPFFLSTSCSFCLSWPLTKASTSAFTVGSMYVPLTLNGISARVAVGDFITLATSRKSMDLLGRFALPCPLTRTTCEEIAKSDVLAM